MLFRSNLDESINKEEVITACLLHDIGNLVKFNLNRFPELNDPEGLEYWQSAQQEFWAKYGKNEHDATLGILQEIGVSARIVGLVEDTDFAHFKVYADSGDMAHKILLYADNRVSMHGIVSLEERFEEVMKRSVGLPGYVAPGDKDILMNYALEVQRQIFSKCKISPEDITDESIKSIALELQNFVIPGSEF